MKKLIIILAVFAVLIGVFFLLTTPWGSKTVVEDSPYEIELTSETRKGYEVIDLRTKSVWLTTDFTSEEFEALKLPVSWIKNDSVRVGVADDARFIKSPGCSESGNYNVELMFGKEFLQVTELIDLGGYIDDTELLRMSRLEKHHELVYSTGSTVKTIISPEGSRYILVSRDANRTSEDFDLPTGWLFEEIIITEDLLVLLSGEIEVIRTDNNDSYQGPLDEDFKLIN